ncbi:MAG: alpha/beta hydrolase [Microscillaceae bacterium]|jgi:pimeloyl-ACP methyl ester carboxylesterase|nr:alpha/beta hydrolase [Microscillaceae bacterium]
MKNPLIKAFVEINGAKIYYQTLGIGNGFPIVFIHGLANDCRVWQPQFEAFSSYFKPIVYDVRGFGQSTPAEPHLAADDLKALLDELQIAQAHIIGVSMGGNIALNFAQCYPERVAKLVAVDADVYGFDDYTAEFKQLFREVYELGKTKGALPAKLHWARSPLLQPKIINEYTPLIAQMIKEYSGIHLTDPKLLPGANPPTASRLIEIKAPTLVIVGENDLQDFQRIADLLVQKIPNAQKIVILQAGHQPNLEAPETFNELVIEFLRD